MDQLQRTIQQAVNNSNSIANVDGSGISPLINVTVQARYTMPYGLRSFL